HTRFSRDWSSDVCSSDLAQIGPRGDVDDRATVGHLPGDGEGEPIGRTEVDVDDLAEVLIGHVDDPGVPGDPGVVDQSDERDFQIAGRVHDGGDAFVRGQVDLDRGDTLQVCEAGEIGRAHV